MDKGLTICNSHGTLIKSWVVCTRCFVAEMGKGGAQATFPAQVFLRN